MVLIVDDSAKKRKTELRKRFLEARIPCAVCNMEKLKRIPSALYTVVYAENENQLSIASIRAGHTKYIAINETGKRMINPDAHFYNENTDGDIVEYVKSGFVKDLGIDIERLCVLPVAFSEKGFLFRNRYVLLTEKEEMIVRFLAISKDNFHTADEIEFYTADEYSPKSNSVAQHICNINKKTTEAANCKMIIAKRGFGYMLDSSVGEISEPNHYDVSSDLPLFV